MVVSHLVDPSPLTTLDVSYIAGKSTLLQILAGKRLVSTPGCSMHISGVDVWQSPPGVTFLGTEWSA